MSKTAATILSEIQDAIYDIVVNRAASVSVNGRSFTALDLDKLQKMEELYEARVNRSSRGMFAVGKFKRAT